MNFFLQFGKFSTSTGLVNKVRSGAPHRDATAPMHTLLHDVPWCGGNRDGATTNIQLEAPDDGEMFWFIMAITVQCFQLIQIHAVDDYTGGHYYSVVRLVGEQRFSILCNSIHG